MKKVSLLSLLTVLAISTAAKANIENPLYTPAKGKIYSKTWGEYSDKDWLNYRIRREKEYRNNTKESFLDIEESILD